jgi:hypothetical protein
MSFPGACTAREKPVPEQPQANLGPEFQKGFRKPSGLGAPALRMSWAMKDPKPGGKKPDVSEPALPSWKAFVIQLSHDTTPDSGIFAGRIEHLGSGRRQRFASGKELLAMVMRLLSDLEASGEGQ